MINHKHKFIFIHIPKTAGNSIDTLFSRKDLVDEGLWHHTSSQLIDRLGLETWNNYYKFTVVRNPWDRLISEYSWQSGTGKRQISTPWGNKEGTFEDFVNMVKGQPNDHLSTCERASPTWYPKSEINNGHLADQTCFTEVKDGASNLDFIIKYENLQSGFNHVCKAIGLEKLNLPHRNKSNRSSNYREYYNESTKAITLEKYNRDIINFNYQF